jgi:excisionase family DNA binding protein
VLLVGESEPLLPDDVVTVVGIDAWQGRVPQLAQLLTSATRQPQGRKIVSPPPDFVSNSPELSEVSDSEYWATDHAALADAIGQSPLGNVASHGLGSGAIASGAERLTLTVEEAATSLGISRASAYEAVRRGDIPAVRIGRRILVPRAALERFLDSASVDDEPPSTA